MKFTVSMKTPDALYDAINGAVADEVMELPISVEAKALEAESRAESVSLLCNKWFQYGEYLCVEIDTEAKTCTVVPV
jgi:hypothetical protein